MQTMWPSHPKRSAGSTIGIKPHLEAAARCDRCGADVAAHEVLWQGIHVCARFHCAQCGQAFVEDLPVGQALFTPYRVASDGSLTGDDSAKQWFGVPLRDSLQRPRADKTIGFRVEIRKRVRQVVVLNCIDYLYGHCLLKLLNAETAIRDGTRELVIIVPSFLRWMVPRYAAEIWEVDISLADAQQFFPALDQRIKTELLRFDTVHLSTAESHPRDFNISHFTSVPRHDFSLPDYRITFVWRPDRLWLGDGVVASALRRPALRNFALNRQQGQISRLFAALRRRLPHARLTVAGIGRETRFVAWIDDRRVVAFDRDTEVDACRVYAESRVVIGVHGSNMLLPPAHAGMAIDLMPTERWPNMAQDILYHQADFGADQRVASFRYRYLPLETSPRTLEDMIVTMCTRFSDIAAQFSG